MPYDRPSLLVAAVSIQDLKTLLRTRRRLNDLGVNSRHCDLDQTCQRVRASIIARRGLRNYLFDMLGRDARRPVSDCRFVGPDYQELPVPVETGSVIDVLTDHFAEDLPWGVIIANNGDEPKLLVL